MSEIKIPESAFAKAWAAYVATPPEWTPSGELSHKSAVQAAVRAAVAEYRESWPDPDRAEAERLVGIIKERDAHIARLSMNYWDVQAAQKRIAELEAEARNLDSRLAAIMRDWKTEHTSADGWKSRNSENEARIAELHRRHDLDCERITKAESALTAAGYVRCDGEAGWEPPIGRKPLHLRIQRWEHGRGGTLTTDPDGDWCLWDHVRDDFTEGTAEQTSRDTAARHLRDTNLASHEQHAILDAIAAMCGEAK